MIDELNSEEELDFSHHNSRHPNDQNNYVEVEGIIKHETSKAILLIQGSKADRNYREKWIPISQIRKIEHHKDGTATLEIAEWIAKRNDLEY